MPVVLLAIALSWEARVHFTFDPPRKGGSSEGAIHVQGKKVRIEEDSPFGPLVILFDGEHLRMLRPDKKTYFELPAAEAPYATVPPSSLEGMTKVGKEMVDGKACDIWEARSETPLGKVRQRVSIPDDAKDFIWLKAATRTKNGATLMEAVGPRKKPQPDALFRVPNHYTKSTSP
jgi:hypothetical protein